MKQCKYCKSEIDNNAKICPHCRKKQKNGKGLLIGIIAVILFIAIGASLSNNESDDNTTSDTVETKTEPKETTAETKKEEKKVEVMKIDPETLITDYEANEVKGDEIYDGKMMELTGTIEDIGKDVLEEVYITFEREDEFEFTCVQCYFKDKDQIKKVMELSKGDKVTIQGKCTGKFGNVTIENCILK